MVLEFSLMMKKLNIGFANLLKLGLPAPNMPWEHFSRRKDEWRKRYPGMSEPLTQETGSPSIISGNCTFVVRAAEQGHQYAQYALGKLYFSGDETMQDKGQTAYWLTQSAAQGNQYAQFLLNHQNENRSPSVLLSATRLLYHMSRVFQETPLPSNPAGYHVESKLMQRIREKKIAAGHKPDDHEEHGYTGPVM